jgi:hypothetical protein
MGILEGRLVVSNSRTIEVALASGGTITCAIDGRTYIDRERQRLQPNELKRGDFLEMVTERQGPSALCFARMIHVSNGLKGQLRFDNNRTPGSVKRATESFSPRGNVQMTGLVRDVQPAFLEVRTRQDGIVRLRLRPDTLFLRDGDEVTAAALERTQPVELRAGYTLDGHLEVYRVVWGSITQPGNPSARPKAEPLY